MGRQGRGIFKTTGVNPTYKPMSANCVDLNKVQNAVLLDTGINTNIEHTNHVQLGQKKHVMIEGRATLNGKRTVYKVRPVVCYHFAATVFTCNFSS